MSARPTCSLPQSNCMSLRSGKKSCCRTTAVRRGPAPLNQLRCTIAVSTAAERTMEGSGWLHTAITAVVRACKSDQASIINVEKLKWGGMQWKGSRWLHAAIMCAYKIYQDRKPI